MPKMPLLFTVPSEMQTKAAYEKGIYMKHILFVCHGNICRSTMAEFLFRDMVKKAGLEKEFYITSRATSTEELGNPVHPGTRRVLESLGIDCSGKYAQQITKRSATRRISFS